MSLWSVGYILIFIIALIVTIWFRVKITIPAKPRWFWRWLYIVAAAMVAGVTWLTAENFDGLVSGGFIAAMLLVFAFWQRGLTQDSVINGLGSVRQFRVLTAIQLQPLDDGCLLAAMVGSVAVVRLKFNRPVDEIAKFLRQKMDPKRVVIVS
ncbi:hypothetical protein [Lacticaseibacillus porcinae]|uniref:hypothetical protein n=1 Tax=Lacticaseibacillus porcinae TaxID=1123687 RepID=UPI000F79FE6A|nr:hypothetical protein [Lacticaseibacillus porcinae]